MDEKNHCEIPEVITKTLQNPDWASLIRSHITIT